MASRRQYAKANVLPKVSCVEKENICGRIDNIKALGLEVILNETDRNHLLTTRVNREGLLPSQIG